MYFSIIIPVYNAENYIVKCLESIKAQSFTDFEVLIINDGSKDNSEPLIKTFVSNDSRFKLFSQKNGGVSATRNSGLSKASGDYIIFIDSDDSIEPTLLEEIVSTNNNYDIIQYDFYKDFVNSKKEINIKSELPEIIQGEGAVVWKRAFKKELVKNISFDEALIGGEDYLFCVQAFLNCNSFYYINKPLYNYNVSNVNSAMHNNFIRNFQHQLTATKNVELLLEHNNLLEKYKKDLNERYFWCLAEFNNWYLGIRGLSGFTRKVVLKIIKILLKIK